MGRQGMSFFDVALWMSRMHRDYFRELYPPNAGRLAELRAEAEASLEEQRAVEARDTLPFAEFVARYTAGSLV
jgi:glutamate--cysteine ligase